MFTFRCLLTSAAALLLVACGGGATNGSSPGGNNAGGNNGNGNPGGNTGSSVFYLPFVATTSGGAATDLYVVPSDNLSSTPILVTQISANSQIELPSVSSKKPTLNGSNVVTSLSPYALLYFAVGSDNNVHVYALNLANTAVAPGATQVSSLSLASGTDICPFIGSAQTNLFDPTTQFLVLHTNAGGQSSCGKGGDVYQVVHYTDSPTTAPVAVNITDTKLTALYQASGALGGVVLLDSATGDLDFYGSDSFTSPTVLTTGVTSSSDLVDDSTVNNTGSLGASTAFLAVKTNNVTSVWRVDSSGVSANVYTATGFLSGAADSRNVYFLDSGAPGGAEKIYQEAMSGGTPLELYGVASTGLSPPPMYSLVGSNGTSLVLTQTTLSASVPPSGPSVSVVTLPVGTPAAATTSIAGPFSGQVFAWMCPSAFGDVASDDVVLNVLKGGLPGSTTPTSYSSEVLTPGGVVKQSEKANSLFLISILPGACAGNFGSVLQVQDITDTNGGYGGGSVSAFNLSSFSATVLGTTSGSGSYFVPAGDNVLVLGTGFLSDTIGSGIIGSVASGGSSSGLAFDVSKSLIVPVTVPNSNVGGLL